MYFVDLLVPPEITNWCALSRSQSSRHKGLLVRLVSVRHLVFLRRVSNTVTYNPISIQSNIESFCERKCWEQRRGRFEVEILLPGAIEGSKFIIWCGEYVGITNAGQREKVNFPSQNLRGWIQSMTLNLLRTYHQPDTNHYLRPKRGFILLHRYHSIHSQEWAPENLSHWSSLSDGCMNLFRNSKRIQILKKWMKAEQRLKE